MTAHATATIKNGAGIHCRPSTHIIKTLQDCPAEVKIIKPGEGESDLKSMLSLMMLALTCDTEVDVEVSGPEEDDWCRKVVELLETEYDFPDAGSAG